MDIRYTVENINNMTHYEMARLWRFGAGDSAVFQRGTPECEAFMERWTAFGGMTTAISKAIGW